MKLYHNTNSTAESTCMPTQCTLALSTRTAKGIVRGGDCSGRGIVRGQAAGLFGGGAVRGTG